MTKISTEELERLDCDNHHVFEMTPSEVQSMARELLAARKVVEAAKDVDSAEAVSTPWKRPLRVALTEYDEVAQ